MTPNPDAARRIAALHARGDLKGAASAGALALAERPDDANLLHMVGVIACQSGNPARGAMLMERAWKIAPSPGLRVNYAKALVDLGRLDTAAALCAEASDGAGPINRLHAEILRKLGRPGEAAARYRAIVTAEPRDFQAWNNLGNALADAGDDDAAIAALTEARRLQPRNPLVALNLGRALTAARRFDSALLAMRDAAGLAPQDALILLEYGRALNRVGDHDAALRQLSAAARISRTDPEIFVAIGLTYAALAEFGRAEEAYQLALKLNPRFAPAYLNLGIHYEQSNRADALDTLVQLARSNGTDMRELAYLEALSRRRAGDFKGALELARASDDETTDATLKYQLIGQLADREGDADTAFAAFTTMNAAAAGDPIAARFDTGAHWRYVDGLLGLVTPEWAARWTPPVTGDGAAPAFLVGFPRSGTTLLDTVLMGHPGVHVLEEEPIVAAAQATLGDWNRLADLDADAIRSFRQRYFAELQRVSPPRHGQLVVDKLPLNLLRTPFIHRIFPDAKFIFAQRHPCDVVLSCYMQSFKINQAMATFLTLADTATLYDRALQFWTRCRAIFPLAAHDLVYEDLLVDMPGVIAPLLDFLGLPWDDAVLDHGGTARQRGYIRTPSYAQVAEPLYRRADGRWLRYRAQLAPVLPVLLPWAERLGYPVAAG